MFEHIKTREDLEEAFRVSCKAVIREDDEQLINQLLDKYIKTGLNGYFKVCEMECALIHEHVSQNLEESARKKAERKKQAQISHGPDWRGPNGTWSLD